MNFGEAIEGLKNGKKLSRDGWPPGMFVVFQKGYPHGIPINKNTAEATGIPEGTVCKFGPYLMIRGADSVFLPWTASQADMLAEDWCPLSN